MAPKILIVLTSHDQLGDTGKKTGFWLEEFAAPYYTFKVSIQTRTSESIPKPLNILTLELHLNRMVARRSRLHRPRAECRRSIRCRYEKTFNVGK